MRICQQKMFAGIQGFKLGWAPLGPPLMTVYCYVLGDLMIDTGQAHMRREALQISSACQVKRVFLTHHHEDHSGNAAALKKYGQVRVFGQAVTRSKMAGGFPILPYQKYVWGRTEPLEVELFPEVIETSWGNLVPVSTPGHAKDHTAFLLPERGVLFSGDLYLADTIKYFRVDEDVGTQIESLRKVLTLEFDILLCSHFPKRENGKLRIHKKLLFLEDLYGAVIRLWRQGQPAKVIFRNLNLKEDYFTKYFCFGNVSLFSGVKSIIRHYETRRDMPGQDSSGSTPHPA